MKEKMIAEYKTWFAIFLKCLSEIKVDAQIKAEYAEEYRQELDRNARADVWHEGDHRRRIS